MTIRWKIIEPEASEKIKKLSLELNNLNPFLTELLIRRNIETLEQAKSFFRPNLNETHDPFLFKDMEKAVNRLNLAIQNREKILIYGDYDVDGTTSVALVYSYLSQYYDNLGYYIPDRYAEGYGISFKGIDYAEENDFSLIIALDCGIKAFDKIEYANKKNIDFIICDHHEPGETIPDAVAVLDAKRKDCSYPFKELSGCGVGYKFMLAWSSQNNHNPTVLSSYLDLLAISICADIVPIIDENRIFVYHGLKLSNSSPRKGIEALISTSGIKHQNMLSTHNIVFHFAPRINAAGRLKSGNKAVELLISSTTETANDLGAQINKLNSDRKTYDENITQEALRKIESDESFSLRKTTVVYDESWSKGIIGIVASRLIETHYRPTIVLTESNGKATGSARSIDGFNLYSAIESCSHLLEQFGGHAHAAGLTLKIENINSFSELFDKVVSESISDESLIPQIYIDQEINLTDINEKFMRILNQFEPFGPGNMRPTFMSKNLFCKENPLVLKEDHLKMIVFQENNPDVEFSCIGFNMSVFADQLTPGVPFSMAFKIEKNIWRNETKLQLNIIDIKFD